MTYILETILGLNTFPSDYRSVPYEYSMVSPRENRGTEGPNQEGRRYLDVRARRNINPDTKKYL